MLIWGETGSRNGATQRQIASVAFLWAKYGIEELHDGDCKGVDSQLFSLAMIFGVDHLVIHPPTNPANRAFCGQRSSAEKAVSSIRPEKPYFVRDRDVVEESEVMACVPDTPFEKEKGGTWYTIRHTRKQGKPLAIAWPNGHISYENWESVVAL